MSKYFTGIVLRIAIFLAVVVVVVVVVVKDKNLEKQIRRLIHNAH